MNNICYCGNNLIKCIQNITERNIFECINCGLLYDNTSYEKAELSTLEKTQLDGLENIYIYEDALKNQIMIETKFIDDLCRFCKNNKNDIIFDNKSVLDIGCSNGLRRQGFLKNKLNYYATDLNFDLFSVYNKEHMDEFINLNDIHKYSFDFLFCWHTLEHFTSVNDFITLVNKVSKTKTIMMLQIPCFDKKHLVDCHFLFFNEKSLTHLFNILRYKTITFYYDNKNNFLTYIGEKI